MGMYSFPVVWFEENSGITMGVCFEPPNLLLKAGRDGWVDGEKINRLEIEWIDRCEGGEMSG
jgi:hypothetical protein